MKTLSRDARLLIGIFGALLVVTIFAALQRGTEEQFPALSTLSSAPDGARALKLWVEELGYPVDERTLASFVPPPEASIMFMFEPLFPTESEMRAVDAWVEAGGTLIAIGDGYGMYSVLDHYEFFFANLPDGEGASLPESPLFESPPLSGMGSAKANYGLDSERDDFVVLSAYKGTPVLVSFEHAKGRVLLGTINESFTNAGLKEPGNPELALNVLAIAQTKGVIWFDEWHHGVQSGEQILGPAEFLRATPVGRSILFIAFAGAIALFMQGRGFGRPIPLPHEIKRRGAFEHVAGIANLTRRAAHRTAVLTQYRHQIKRKLGKRYRLDPNMDDESYVNALAGYNPALNKTELLDLLKRLSRRTVNESEMVQFASEAAKWIDD